MKPNAVAAAHHRHLDVSSLKLACDDPFPSSKDQTHRASADVWGSISTARQLIGRLRK